MNFWPENVKGRNNLEELIEEGENIKIFVN
jgi:hypothetical protein